MSRKIARETAMKMLYQMDIGGLTSSEVIKDFNENYEGSELGKEELEYIDDCVNGTYDTLKDIDAVIEKNLKDWKINRVAKVELSIMRLAVYEMKNRSDIPKAVAVNEAIELAKKFGGENSSNFINGVLGNIIKEYE